MTEVQSCWETCNCNFWWWFFLFLKPLKIPDSSSCPYLGYCFPSLPDAVLYFLFSFFVLLTELRRKFNFTTISNLMTLLAPSPIFSYITFKIIDFILCRMMKNVFQEHHTEEEKWVGQSLPYNPNQVEFFLAIFQ